MSANPSPNVVDPNALFFNGVQWLDAYSYVDPVSGQVVYINPDGPALTTTTDALGQPTTARTMKPRDWLQFVVALALTGAVIWYAIYLTHKKQ